MKKIFLFFISALLTGVASAQYKAIDQGSTVQFAIKNFGFTVNGTFTGVQGDISFDPQNVNASSFDVSVNAGSVNTDNHLRDHHLQGETYFDVKNYPRIRFVSVNVTSNGKNGAFNMTGKLTIKKQTRTVSFPFTATPTTDGYLFKGSFTINRKDFNVGGTSTIADKLDISLNILAKKS